MSLVTRLTLYLLTALALVVVCFSVTLYWMTRQYLYRQLDAQLVAALDTLEAAVDVESGGLEWEPLDRRIVLPRDSGLESLQWCVSDRNGQVIDESSSTAADLALGSWRTKAWPVDPPDGTAFGMLQNRKVAGRRLRLSELLQMGRGHSEDDGPEDDVEYPEIYLVAAISQAPAASSLRYLTGALAGISAAVVLGGALLSRALGRRALAPVRNMALATRRMSGATWGQRLPMPHARDELADLSESFNELLGRLEETAARQQRFAADASHQLRTPLAGLMSLAEVTARRERPAEEYREALHRVAAEAKRMQHIVESLLFLARLDHVETVLDAEAVPLSDWLANQRTRWDQTQEASRLRFLGLEGRAPCIRAHPQLLSQLLDNLIDNALKHSPLDSPIEIKAVADGTTVGFAVIDHGDGIAPDTLPHIFKPFYRARELAAGVGGVGLGLAVARGIASAFDGTILVDSAPGVGTRFEVRFPLGGDSTSAVRERTN